MQITANVMRSGSDTSVHRGKRKFPTALVREAGKMQLWISYPIAHHEKIMWWFDSLGKDITVDTSFTTVSSLRGIFSEFPLSQRYTYIKNCPPQKESFNMYIYMALSLLTIAPNFMSLDALRALDSKILKCNFSKCFFPLCKNITLKVLFESSKLGII